MQYLIPAPTVMRSRDQASGTDCFPPLLAPYSNPAQCIVSQIGLLKCKRPTAHLRSVHPNSAAQTLSLISERIIAFGPKLRSGSSLIRTGHNCPLDMPVMIGIGIGIGIAIGAAHLNRMGRRGESIPGSLAVKPNGICEQPTRTPISVSTKPALHLLGRKARMPLSRSRSPPLLV